MALPAGWYYGHTGELMTTLRLMAAGLRSAALVGGEVCCAIIIALIDRMH
jgi:hypothetical protein